MRITTLIENTTSHDDLTAEHGLSLYIETKHHNILFDAGQTAAFAANAERLGIDLTNVDLAVLSHGHYDHSGGLLEFIQINKTAPVFMSKHAFADCYHGTERYIGIDQRLKCSDRVQLTDDLCPIGEGLTLFSCNDKERSYLTDSFGLTILKDGQYKDDSFLHEQYLLIEEDGKRVLISGCSHKGILNIAAWFSPDVLIGGFHFMNLVPGTADSNVLDHAAKILLQYPTTYYTGHCTGSAPFAHMKAIMADRLHAISTGVSISI